MSENRTFWNGFTDEVFGSQPGPTDQTTDTGIYPVCQRQQQRIFSLENILYGLEFIITPLLQQLAAGSPTKINDETDKLPLTGGADSLPGAGGTGTVFKVSLYSLSTNANCTVITGSGNDFIFEPGTSVDLYTSDPASITVTGTAANIISLVYSYLLP